MRASDVSGQTYVGFMTEPRCPECFTDTGIRRISYGYPAGPPDESKYVLGGCSMRFDNAELRCVECGWEGPEAEAKLAARAV